MLKCITIRAAEKLAKDICSLMRDVATLATPEMSACCESCSFHPILSELIGAASETGTYQSKSCVP